MIIFEEYDVRIIRNVLVSMRDGARLATDIYLPLVSGCGDPDEVWPVLVERTPYDKVGTNRSESYLTGSNPKTRPEIALEMAKNGFAVVIQDCRGRYASEGVFTKYVNEAEDGFDCLTWISEQPWCNGKIGTYGVSYAAHVQTAMAALRPPGLSAMFIDSGGFWNAYHEGIRQGGCFELKQAVWAYRHALKKYAGCGNDEVTQELKKQDLNTWFSNMPWNEGNSPLSAAPEYETYLFKQWRTGNYSDYWENLGLCAEGNYENFPDIPIYILGSWYDVYVRSSVQHFIGLIQSGKRHVELTMGPWVHGERSKSYAGDLDFGPTAIFENIFEQNYVDFRIDWFNRCLKDSHIKNASNPPEENVKLFVMGGGSNLKNQEHKIDVGGAWHTFKTFPLNGTCVEKYFLASNDALSLLPPVNDMDSKECVYDPDDPVPTVGGAVTSGEPVMVGGGFDQNLALSDRSDILSFETPELGADVVVAGEIQVVISVSSDCVDTDFHVKLLDVFPLEGETETQVAVNLAHGVLRMRYRNSWDKPEFMENGEIYQVKIPLTPVAMRFAKGHKIRIDVTSSNFPHFDLNSNTGEAEGHWSKTKVARNTVHFNRNHSSWIEIPVLDKNEIK